MLTDIAKIVFAFLALGLGIFFLMTFEEMKEENKKLNRKKTKK